MLLTQEQIVHIAKLANVKLATEDIEKYQQDLNNIVGYVETLNSVPAESLASIQDSVKPSLTLHEDVREDVATRDEMLSCSPQQIINHQIAIANIMH